VSQFLVESSIARPTGNRLLRCPHRGNTIAGHCAAAFAEDCATVGYDPMGNTSLLDRRRFLLGVVPAVTVGTLGVTSCSNKIPTATPSSYAPTYFNNAEWTFINAAVGRLIPSEGAGPGGVDAGVTSPRFFVVI
jgi:hypothetical protein